MFPILRKGLDTALALACARAWWQGFGWGLLAGAGLVVGCAILVYLLGRKD